MGQPEQIRAAYRFPNSVTELVEQGCVLAEMARGYWAQQREVQAVRAGARMNTCTAEAEASLQRRMPQDWLSAAAVHQHAQQTAEKRNLPQPARSQQFLDRVFRAPDLWAL